MMLSLNMYAKPWKCSTYIEGKLSAQTTPRVREGDYDFIEISWTTLMVSILVKEKIVVMEKERDGEKGDCMTFGVSRG